MKKTLGGDRINSGKKMEVNLHEFGFSRHNVGNVVRTQQAVGTIVPIWSRLLLKNNKLELDLNATCYTNPTEGPAFAEYDLHINVFSAPLRLYNANLALDLIDEGTKMNEIKFPMIKFVADKIDWNKNPNNQQIAASCVHQYLGTRGLGDAEDPVTQTTVTRYRNANKLLMYTDCCAHYYSNKQEKIGYVIHNVAIQVLKDIYEVQYNGDVIPQAPTIGSVEIVPDTAIEMVFFYNPPLTDESQINNLTIWTENEQNVLKLTDVFKNVKVDGGNITCSNPVPTQVGNKIINWNYITAEEQKNNGPQLYEYPLANINIMRRKILAAAEQTTPFIIDQNSIAPYGLSLGQQNGVWSKTTNQEGLFVACYNSDLLNNWLDTESIDNINAGTRMMVEEGGITMEQFLLSEKLYQYQNRIQLAGNTISDWEEAAYGQRSKRPATKPVFEGGLSKTIVFDEVVSTAPSQEQPTGTLVGRGVMGNKHHGGKIHIHVEEASLVMVLAHIVPRLDYTQGNDWEGDLETYEDLHNPNKDRIGFQDLPTDWAATWDTKIGSDGKIIMKSFGKQTSWIHYQTNINQDYAGFAEEDNEGWMVNGRNYEYDPETRSIKDATTYIDPAKWNNIFALKSRDAMNYRMQYKIDAVQKIFMSANQIPGF